MGQSLKIYTLHDPDTLDVRYVGFTSKTLERRLAGHVRLAICKNSPINHRLNWIRSLIDSGKSPVILIVETVSDSNWEERERFWISHFRKQGCDLVNGTDGGDGLRNPTEFVRLKISSSAKAACGSDEARKRMSSNSKKNWENKQYRDSVVLSKVGKPRPQWVRDKISKSHRGRIIPDDVRVKMSSGQKLRWSSPEQRKKMSLAQKLAMENPERLSQIINASKKSGELSSKPIVSPDGIVYESVNSAARKLGVWATTVSRWVRSGNRGWRFLN